MNRIYVFLLVTLVTVSFLSSCSSFSESEKVGDKFYEMTKSRNYADLQSILSPSALEATPIDQWKSAIAYKDDALGKLTSYTQTYTGVKTDNGATTYEIRYDVKYENGEMKELFYFEKVDKQILIKYYEYDNNLVNSLTPIKNEKANSEQEQVCQDFYTKIQQKDYNGIVSLISDAAKKATPEKEWVKTFQDLEKTVGAFKNYTFMSITTKTFEDGDYYELMYKVEYEKYTIYEKFQFKKDTQPNKFQFFE